MSNSPEQGWYPNPENPAEVRWWDGNAWTAHTERNPMAVPDHGTPPPPGQGDGAPAWIANHARSSVSSWLGEVIQLTKQRFVALSILALLLSGLPSLASGAFLWFSLRDATLFIPSVDANEVVELDDFVLEGVEVRQFVLFVCLALLTQIVSIVLWVAQCRQTHLARALKPEPWADSLLPSLKRMPRVLGAVLLMSLAMTLSVIALSIVMGLSGAISPVLLLVTIPASFIGGLYLFTRLSLVVVSAALGPKGLWSMPNSWKLTEGRSSMLFGRLALLGLLSVVFSLVFSSVSAISGSGSEPLILDQNEDLLLTFEMLYGSSGLGFFVVIFLISFLNALMLGFMLGGLVLLYEDFGGELDPDLATSAVIDAGELATGAIAIEES